MNSRNTRKRKAFTLLEMVITMSIVSIIMASAFFIFKQNPSDTLQKIAPEIEALTFNANRSATKKNRAYYIIATHEKIFLSSTNSANGNSNSEENSDTQLNSVSIPPDVFISFKREEEDTWTTISERSDPLVWVVSRTGIAEKISLKLEYIDASFEITFDPLTGNLLTQNEENQET